MSLIIKYQELIWLKILKVTNNISYILCDGKFDTLEFLFLY